jgi:hypothetical protein
VTPRAWLVVVAIVVLLALAGGGAAVIMRKISETEASRRALLEPDVQQAVDRIRADAAAEGIETMIGSTRRTADEQAAKVAAGLSATKNSWHTIGRALEMYVMRRIPAPTAKDPNATKLSADVEGKEIAKYQRLHAIAKRHGGRGIPGGQPFTATGEKAYITTSAGKIWDVAHIEFPGGFATVADALKAQQARKVV